MTLAWTSLWPSQGHYREEMLSWWWWWIDSPR